MTVRPFIVRCMVDGCPVEALYKLAAEWSDGTIQELKSYGLACEQHLPTVFRLSREKRGRCRLAGGESLSEPRIFRLEPGARDRQLVRQTDLEVQLAR